MINSRDCDLILDCVDTREVSTRMMNETREIFSGSLPEELQPGFEAWVTERVRCQEEELEELMILKGKLLGLRRRLRAGEAVNELME